LIFKQKNQQNFYLLKHDSPCNEITEQLNKKDMGCDIHIIAEVKENGVWRKNTAPVFPNPYFKDYKRYQLQAVEAGDPDVNIPDFATQEFSDEPGSQRHYDWFAVLANVRNGRGFAGVKTGQGFAVIAEPRGIPVDASQEWLEIVEQWDCDMHSRSYLYYEDFEKFDFNQITMKQGIIPIEEYKVLRETNAAPKEWCGGISGPGIKVINVHEADALLNTSTLTEGIKFHVMYEWPVLYSEWFAEEIKSIVEPLKELTITYGDARLVFGFDN
jgi:hypothetical protein